MINHKNKLALIILLVFLTIIFFIIKYFHTNRRIFAPSGDYSKIIVLHDNGLAFFASTKASTVSDFLITQNILLSEFDQVIPEKNSPLISGGNIFIRRAVKITIVVDGKTLENYTLATNVRNAIVENNIALGRLDQTVPGLNSLPTDNLKIVITRIDVEEKIILEDIDFKTTEKTDAKLSWREKKVQQKGEKGIREVKYKITYKNGKEISRVILEKNITKEPAMEIVLQGTYMELGNAKRGEASRYAESWGNLNASRDIPRGGYAKVTNMDNRKTTVVKINDYGPQSPIRIIDLSYEAFSRIANPGQGIIHSVKVEQILN
jgi:uncharacterized protein YabE (DUF348 family)